ncbi:MAG TPA: hypothetical protein PLV42_05725 [bacterium]|nr:hypothetical protein [bacterium]
MRVIFFLIAFLLLCVTKPLTATDKPGYLVYRTGNLILYFSTDIDERLIPYLIEKTELAEQFLISLYGWKADRRIPLVFDRETDEANGWSSVYMKDGIRLLLYPPEEFSPLANHKDYALNLVVHELTHSLQIGLVSGVPKWINYVFGNLFYPAQLSPGWLLEGVTVYSESAIDGTGRLHSPLWRAWFESFFRKGNELTLGELSGANDHWMGGHIPYLYGTFFYDFLMRRHGPENMALFFDELSDNVIPFLIEYEARKIFDESLWSGYQEFLRETRERLFERTTEAQAPFETGLRYSEIAVDRSRPGHYAYYGRRQGENAIYEFDGKETKRIFTPPGALHFSTDGTRHLATITVRADADRIRSDLFLFDTERGEIARITQGESVLYPFFLPDGRIACFVTTNGLIALRIYNREHRSFTAYDLAAFDAVHTPAVDPAGERILFTGNLRGADKDLFLLDIATGAVSRLTMPGNQYSAVFAAHDSILFSTDEGERIVPLMLDLASGTLMRLYEPISIALYPQIIDDRLFFVGFDNDGYFPAWVPLRTVEMGMLPTPLFVPFAADAAPARAETPELTPSNGWEGMWPSVIIPDYSAGLYAQKLGFTLFAEADTGRRGYEVSFGKVFDPSDKYEVRLFYRDNDIMPEFRWQISYGWYRVTFGDEESHTYPGWIHDLRTSASTAMNFNTLFYLDRTHAYKVGHSLSTSIGFRMLKEGVRNDYGDPTTFPYLAGEYHNLQMGAAYSLRFGFSPGSYLLFSDMDATTLRLPVTLVRDLLYGDSLLTMSPSFTYSYLFDHTGKVGLITRHSLYAAFLSDARYAVGGEEKDAELENIDTFIYGYSSDVTVRGYRPAALTGNILYFSNNELRFHIFSIEQGLGLLPLMIKNLQGALFVDIGTASGDPDLPEIPFIASTGAEIKLLTYWWYRVPLMFKLGLAHGLTKEGVLNVYFSLGNSF